MTTSDTSLSIYNPVAAVSDAPVPEMIRNRNVYEAIQAQLLKGADLRCADQYAETANGEFDVARPVHLADCKAESPELTFYDLSRQPAAQSSASAEKRTTRAFFDLQGAGKPRDYRTPLLTCFKLTVDRAWTPFQQNYGIQSASRSSSRA